MAKSAQEHSVFQFPDDSNLWGGKAVSKINGETQYSGHLQRERKVKCLTQFLLDSVCLSNNSNKNMNYKELSG